LSTAVFGRPDIQVVCCGTDLSVFQSSYVVALMHRMYSQACWLMDQYSVVMLVMIIF